MDTGIERLERLEGVRLRAIAAMMAESFDHDPMQQWLFPHAARRTRRLRRFFERDVRHRLNGRAHPYCAGVHGVAFWHPPSEADSLQFRSALQVAPALTSVVVHHPLTALRVLAEVLRRRPEEPHWYLSHLAVSASHRGRGLGRELLLVGIEHARTDGTGVYLETSNPDNVPFYSRSGFRETGVVEVPGAPAVWLLWRPAELR